MKNERIEIIENDESQNIDDFYITFKEKLEEIHTFPSDYVFKFIVSADQSKIAKLHTIFENAGASISSKESRTGKYSSFTVKAQMNDADDVVLYYRQVASIDGVVML